MKRHDVVMKRHDVRHGVRMTSPNNVQDPCRELGVHMLGVHSDILLGDEVMKRRHEAS